MNGIINLNKPAGISSARALDRVRAITGQRRSGHAGTLDPAADGVLVICLGKATKLVEAMMDQPKVYRTEARLDVTSESFDSDRPLISVAVQTPPSEARLRESLRAFRGEIQQAPPAISAVKVGGRRAYALTHAGRPPELPPRPVRVHELELLSYEWPRLTLRITCGRGFYVRALIRDIGAALSCGGCLTGLTRLAVGPFRFEQAWSLAALAKAAPADYLIELPRVLELLGHPRP
ncbi:MAG: tRNA pseudouridine(55) synthase TruB [Phycisphaerae bacterium]|nr:tRNA pseudouridine(55) synthase TruB [Phycisphaerae bacterium]MCZ2398440.1 tRNA pseudouridine(55) synthase TruB [Phycisphaerae bacterium]